MSERDFVQDFLARHPLPAAPTSAATSGTRASDIALEPELETETAEPEAMPVDAHEHIEDADNVSVLKPKHRNSKATELAIAPELQPQIHASWCENPWDLFYWDVESRSAATLGKGKSAVGARAYAEHPTTEVLAVAYARGNGEPAIWVPPDPIPEAVLRAAKECEWVAHHAAFDRAMLETELVKLGWPLVPPERHICSMILALSHSLPDSLEGAAATLGLEQQKDVVAQRAIKKMFKPRKPRPDEGVDGLYWHDTPELRALLYQYAKQDIVTMRELHQHLAPLSEAEQEVAVIDAEINDKGILIDATLAAAAARLAGRALADLDVGIKHLTNGAVTATSQVARLKAWLMARGVKLPRKPHNFNSQGGMQWKDSLDGDDIEKLLAEDLPADVRAVLQIRLQAAQSAVSKIERMVVTRCTDGRVRNVYRMLGARTGRWSGEGFQPQNLKRPVLLKDDAMIAAAIELVLAGDYAGIKQRHGDVLGVLGDLCRSILIPAPGHRFIVGDFSAIEARVLTWLAGDADKLTRFREFDCARGRELYCTTAEEILGLKHEVTSKSPERALGKVFELGLGYQMGGARLLSHIRTAKVPNSDRIIIKETNTWVKKWRQKNPKIVEFWAMLAATARAAVRNPEMAIPCGPIQFQMRDGVLCLRLPSGRELKYPAPVVKLGRFGESQVTFLDMKAGARRGEQMYGGKWAENVTSATARDLLVEAMKRLRAAGYRLSMHTHDEIVAEMPIGAGDVDEFKRLLVEAPTWASGLPIAAKVFEATRFKKD
jgi:DNA polymerase bacteriophage-type